MTYKKMFDEERKLFVEEMKLNKALSLRNENDYLVGLEKAFNDAFNQYARRNKIKYKNNISDLIKPVTKTLFSYFNSEETSFDNCFKEAITESMKIFDNDSYGIAQKFVNMSFKYLYCYEDAQAQKYEGKFKDCHMPLDKYTIRWVRSLKDTDINKKLSAINNAWTNIDEDLYKKIQKLIGKKLESGYEYRISFAPNEEKIKLPNNKLYAEFIIWHQEKLNEIHKTLEKVESDFYRLGIKSLD